jgi:hypothetical protein
LQLLDGRHTLHAVVRTGIGIEAMIEHYQVAGQDGFAQLAERLHPCGEHRDLDIHRAAALGAVWPPSTLKLVLGALVFSQGISRGKAGGNVATLLVSRPSNSLT